jgi:hypothetical protein
MAPSRRDTDSGLSPWSVSGPQGWGLRPQLPESASALNPWPAREEPKKDKAPITSCSTQAPPSSPSQCYPAKLCPLPVECTASGDLSFSCLTGARSSALWEEGLGDGRNQEMRGRGLGTPSWLRAHLAALCSLSPVNPRPVALCLGIQGLVCS